jgi:hypothetical protein
MELAPLQVRAESDPGSALLVRLFATGGLPGTTQVKITWGDYTESWIDAWEDFYSHIYGQTGDYLVRLTTDKGQQWIALVTVTGVGGVLPIRENPEIPVEEEVS